MATEWLAAIFDPGMEAIASASVDLRQAEVTKGDVFLWLYRHRRLLCAPGGACGFSQTVHKALAHHGKLPRQLRRALHQQAAITMK